LVEDDNKHAFGFHANEEWNFTLSKLHWWSNERIIMRNTHSVTSF
jgi:hypothetical protein